MLNFYLTYFSCPKTVPASTVVRPSYMCKSLEGVEFSSHIPQQVQSRVHLPQMQLVVTEFAGLVLRH